MIYSVLADAVMLLHLCYVVFAALGALLVWSRPKLAWVHGPALAWAILAPYASDFCPLTALENRLRWAAGRVGYEGDYLEHYLQALFPTIRPGAGVVAAVAGGVVLVNLRVYGRLLRGRIHSPLSAPSVSGGDGPPSSHRAPI